MFSKRSCPVWLELTCKAVPGVENSTPRLRNWTVGRSLGEDTASGTPSQPISRRPPANELAAAPLLAPRSARKASTAAWMAAALAPVASRMVATAVGTTRSSSASSRGGEVTCRGRCCFVELRRRKNMKYLQVQAPNSPRRVRA